MRALWAIVQFELGYQLRSPFFRGALLLFAMVHFLASTGTAIHIDISNQIALNSAYAILQIELALFIFGILPIVAFVVTAITRDFAGATAALIFVTPISPRLFVLGRFLGAFSLALLLGLAGLLSALLGTLTPWLDQTRVAAFSPRPWAYVFFVVILPSTFVLCALFFSVAALTRSFALTFAAALAFFVANVFLNLAAQPENGAWAALADPSARLTVLTETRYWTVAELNTQLPWGLLWRNRLLWLTVALLALLWTLARFRLALDSAFLFHEVTRRSTKTSRKISSFLRVFGVRLRGETTPPAFHQIIPALDFSPRATGAQFIAQLKLDLSCVCQSLLIYLIAALTIASLLGELQGNVSRVGFETPLYPLTSVLLPMLRTGMLTIILLVNLWYSAELVHRERACGVSELLHAAPFPDWLLLLSKAAALCLVVNALLLVAVLTFIAYQTASGYYDYELSLYVQSAFLYNGFYFCMLAVLAVVIQALSPNKWTGLLLTLGVYVALLSLPALGFDHVLYGFSLPEAVYSELNGFGHFRQPVLWLSAYWGAFCVLLLLGAYLLYPRGNEASVRTSLREARRRFGKGSRLIAAFAALAFVAIGGWIFYNTNIRNEYLTPSARLQRRADYEKAYGRYEAAPAPSYDSINLTADLFPAERRLESRGHATLGNHKQTPLTEFVVSVKPVLRVNQLAVENAAPVLSDKVQGFYLFRLAAPLAPGATVKMTWHLTRRNPGFVAAEPDHALVANGTYLNTFDVMPVPGLDGERRLTDNAERRQYGLPPAPRTAALGDPAYADRVAYGVDSRAAFDIVFSTSADQIAVAPGLLKKEWRQEGRRYFHYQTTEPILPSISLNSARYAIARDRWNDVALEIYYDPKHHNNVPALLATAKRGLAFFSQEFAPYQYSYFRILECPRYLSGARFHPGTVPYSEAIGFVTDLRALANADYGVLHELAHQWWGDRIIGAQMQGRQLLNETMAEYSTQMLFREFYPPVYLHRLMRERLNGYLNGRSSENEAEVPVMYTENHGYLRAKGPLVLHALQDLIGKEKVHAGLRNFLQEFSFQTSPCPTSRDLVNALRATAGPEHQRFITDWFERMVLYDLTLDAAHARKLESGYEVTLEVTAKQFAADGRGQETEEPLDSWFDVALFAETDKPLEEVTPLFMAKQRLRSGKQSLTVHTKERPGLAALDPFHKLIERSAGNNRLKITNFKASFQAK